jgi:hypothetical protein
VAAIFAGLLANPDFINCLPGLVTDQDRVGVVRERLLFLAAMR